MSRSALLPTTMVCGLVFGLFSSAVVTYVMPRKYESKTLVIISPRDSIQAFTDEQVDRVIATQCLLLTGHENMQRVAQNLDLANRWNCDLETCALRLTAMVSAESLRKTDIYAITCRHTNPEETRDIANGVADAYRQYRLAIENSENEKMLMELRKAVREEEDKLEEKRAILTTLTKNKISIAQPQSDKADLKDAERIDVKRDYDVQDYIDAKRDYEAQMELLQQMKQQQVTETIRFKTRSPEVNIHSPAIIPDRPVSPNITLNLALGCVAGLSAGLCLGLLLMLLGKADGGMARDL